VSHAAALRLGAEAAWRAGRLDEAIGLLEQSARLTPDDPQAWSALAEAFAAANRPELASRAWDRALDLDPTARAALIGKAKSWQALGKPDDAADLLQRALADAPDDFETLFAIAVLALDCGDLERAQAASTNLIGAHGDRPGALWLAARIAAARGEVRHARLAAERLLGLRELGPPERAEALLLLSRMLDAQSLAPAAFAAAVEGKAIQRELFAERAAGRESETDKLRRLASWFAAAASYDWRRPPPAAAPGDPAGHIFLVGFPRSGTTLIEQALAGRPDVVALEEAPTLAAHYAEFLSSRQGFERLARLSPKEASLWRARYWQVVRDFGADPAGRVFLDKAPAGTLNLPIVAKLFPGAKILFAMRDPRDVVLSCLLTGFQMNALTYAFTTLEETVACYGACMTLAEVYRGLFDLDVHEVRYETLVDDFEGQLAAIARFVALPADPAMVDIAATARRRQVRTPSADRIRAGLTRQRLGRWRSYAPQLAPAMAALAPWIARFGYGDQGDGNPSAGLTNPPSRA
jgi:tetratricopeptide (TPR) repeat protein